MIKVAPAIDIIGGRCVRLSQGDFGKATFYSGSPFEMAVRFVEAGFRSIHAVDLDGARAGRPSNLGTLRELSEVPGLEIEWGGGVKTRADVESILEAGASRVVCGTMAVKSPDLFSSLLEEFGGDRIILGADVKGGKVAVSGWLETSEIDIQELLCSFLPILKEVVVTDISRDGMFTGISTGFYRGLMDSFPSVFFTASGGIGSVEDIIALENAGVPRVIVGKALYEGKITLEDLKPWSRRG